MITLHETAVLELRVEVESSLRRADSVLAKVEERMEEFQTWINHLKQTNVKGEIPMEIVNSLNEVIKDNATVENMLQQVEELS